MVRSKQRGRWGLEGARWRIARAGPWARQKLVEAATGPARVPTLPRSAGSGDRDELTRSAPGRHASSRRPSLSWGANTREMPLSCGTRPTQPRAAQRVALVGGEAGAGKTRLAFEIARRRHAAGGRGCCSVTAILRAAARTSRGCKPSPSSSAAMPARGSRRQRRSARHAGRGAP